jgi:hypothetical protein
MGSLGSEQLHWLEHDVKHRRSSTPIVVFAHIPLWTVYPEWGWGTDDSAQALSYLRKFGSVSVLNGHIHQIMQKVEGNVTFHTAASTAFPQPEPGKAASPGPMVVPAGQLRGPSGNHQRPLREGQARPRRRRHLSGVNVFSRKEGTPMRQKKDLVDLAVVTLIALLLSIADRRAPTRRPSLQVSRSRSTTSPSAPARSWSRGGRR